MNVMPEDTNPIFIGAAAALAGVLLSQIISIALSVFDKKHAKKVLLRQKYEELMNEFQNSISYIQDVHTCKTLDQLFQLSHSPHTGKAYGLALLYFPDIEEPLGQYGVSQVSFYNSVITIFNADIQVNAGGQAMMDKWHKQVMQSLFDKMNLVMDALVSNAQKYTKA